MNALDTAFYSRLQGGTTLRNLLAGTTSIYHLQAPEDASYPYIVFSIQGGGDDNFTANRTKNLVVFVRAYATGGAAQAGSIDAQIDTLLHMNPLTVTGWTAFWLARETDLETVETASNGTNVYMVGGLYRCRLDQT